MSGRRRWRNKSEDLPSITLMAECVRGKHLVQRILLIAFLMKSRTLRNACLACMMLFGKTALCRGQVPQDKSMYRLDSVVVRGFQQPSAKTLRSATVSQSIERKQVEQLGMQNVADVLKRFAGTNVKDYGGLGGMKTISVRNMGAAHTAVSYDGVAVSNCQAGQIDIGRFSLDDLQQISLSVGQEDNMLQSARLFASASVLSLQTIHPSLDGNASYSVGGALKLGSFGQVNPSLRYIAKTGQNALLSLSGNYLRSDGAYPFRLTNGKTVTTQKRHNSDIEQYHGEMNLSYTLRDSSTLDVKAYGFYSERGLPGVVILYVNNANERLWDKNYFWQIVYNKTFSKQWKLLAQGKYNYSWNKYTDKASFYSGGIITDRNTQHEGYASVAALYSPARQWSFSLSQDCAVNTLRNNISTSPSPNRYTTLTALNARFSLPRFIATATLVNTYLTEHVKQGDNPKDREHLSPSVNVRYMPFPQIPLYVRAQIKSTFRVPSFNDLYYQRIGNIYLKPEDAKEYNLGITYSKGSMPCLKNLAITADAYVGRVTNKIVAIPAAYVWKMQNHGKVNTSGLDITLAATIPIAEGTELDIMGNYTFQRAIDVTDASEKNYRDQLPYTPRNSGNAAATLRTPWINVGYTLMAVGERYESNQNIETNRMDGYVEQSATLSRTFTIKGWQLSLLASLLNFTNKQYEVVRYYPMPRRSCMFTIKVTV